MRGQGRWPRVDPAEAVILIADLAINLGFFMLIPFISVHVSLNLGLSATVAGTVLATRMGVQQLLMVFAGPIADLYGYKRVILIGLLIRSVGFASFAAMSNLQGLLLSAVLSGIGGALFSSAERAAFAALKPDSDQGTRFSLLYTFQSVGTTLGPLLGALLLSLDFRVLSLVAGLVYLPIALMVLIWLPDLASGRPRPHWDEAVGEMLRSVRAVARNRAFVSYCMVAAGYWAVSGQINISLALHAAAVTGSQTAVKYLFLINSLMIIALQYGLTQRLHGRGSPLQHWSVGAALTAAGFLVLIPFPGMSGMVAAVMLMSFGSMLVRPNDYQITMGMAPRDAMASYYGFSAISVAIGGSTGQYLGGSLTDLATTAGAPWLVWACFAVLGLITALVMARRARSTTAAGAPAA